MHKGRVERVNFVLRRLHHPMRLLPLPQNTRQLTYFVFNRPIFGMILRPSNDAKPTRTLAPRDRLMDVRGVMRSQVVPNKNAMVVCPLDPKLLNLRANVIAEITENVGCCPTAMHTPNPTPRALNTPTDVRRKPWIPRFDCEEDRDLCTKMVVPIFTHPKNTQCPSPRAVALLHRNPELIDVNELASGHLKNSERGGAVKEAPDTELNVLPLSLIGFSGSPLLRNLQLSKALGDHIDRIERPSLVVEEDGHLLQL